MEHTSTAFHLQPAVHLGRRIVIAGGPYWNATWAALCPKTWRVVGEVETLDEVFAVIEAHRPDVVVLSELCPGIIPMPEVIATVRRRLPESRIVLIVEALNAATRQLIQQAALYGVYHIIVGAPTGDTWVQTIEEDRTIHDVMRYYPDAVEDPKAPVRELRTPDRVPVSTVAMALGTLPDDLMQFLTHTFPHTALTDWGVAKAGATTDEMVAAALAEGSGWTTLLVTVALTGILSLAQALGQIHSAHPTLRIAVIAGEDSPEVRRLIDDCARENLRNIYVSATMETTDLASLVTEDWGPERTAAYRSPLGQATAPRFQVAAPPPTPIADPEVVAAQTIAVVSGKGSVGKTSFVANCLVAAGHWGAVGIDADYVKPSLHLAFQAADQAVSHELDQLLVAIQSDGRTEAEQEWAPRDRQTIREWVRNAETVTEGVRIVPGPSRAREVLAAVPPGLVTALAEAAQKTARLTLIDTPGSTMESSWVEAVLAADWIVLVTTPSYSSVLESLDVLRKLDYLHIPRNRIWLVISHNAKREKNGYSVAEITQTHLKNLKFLAKIPDEPAKWHQAWRMHRPLAFKERKVWTEIVQKMTGVDPDRPVKRNPFRRSKKPSAKP